MEGRIYRENDVTVTAVGLAARGEEEITGSPFIMLGLTARLTERNVTIKPPPPRAFCQLTAADIIGTHPLFRWSHTHQSCSVQQPPKEKKVSYYYMYGDKNFPLFSD